MNGAGVLWIFALTFLICADIIGRTVFDRPIKAVTEMVSLSLVGCVFLQIAYSIHLQRLMRVEMALDPLARRQPLLASDWHVFIAAVGFALFALTVVGEWPDFVRAFATAEFAGVEGIFTIQVWPIKLLVVFGSAVAALAFLGQLVAHIRQSLAGGGASLRWVAWLVVVLLAALCAALWLGDAEPRVIGATMIGLALFLILLGMPIAIALLAAGFVGLALLKHDFGIATRTLALSAEGTISEYVFASVPLFVLMGLLVNVSEVGRDAFRAAQRVFGRIHGGLGVATVAANAVFAAISGHFGCGCGHLHEDRGAGDGAARLHGEVCGGPHRRIVAAWHADPAEPAADHLRRARRSVDRRIVPRGGDTGTLACGRVCDRRGADGVAVAELRRQRESSARGQRSDGKLGQRAAGRAARDRADCPRARRHLRRRVLADGSGRRGRRRGLVYRARAAPAQSARSCGK